MSMANSTRPRGPILETQLKTQIRNRLMELLGLVLIFCAFITSTALYSYSPNDPNFLNSTSGERYFKICALSWVLTAAELMILK